MKISAITIKRYHLVMMNFTLNGLTFIMDILLLFNRLTLTLNCKEKKLLIHNLKSIILILQLLLFILVRTDIIQDL